MKALCLIIISVFLPRIATAASQCHYPNGREADGDFPCDPDADDSPCCGGGLGSVCLSNKLCGGPNGNIIRGSCTDQSWESPECAHYCLSANNGGTDLISCSNVTESDTSYCCDHTVNCCNSGVGRFNVLPPDPEVWATWNRVSSQFVVVRTLSEEPSTSTSTIVSTTASSEPSVTSLSEASLTSVPSSTASSTTTSVQNDGAHQTPDPPPTVGEAQQDPGLSTTAKAGIGAGAGAGALLIVAIVFLLLKVRKNKKALEAQHARNQWPPMYQETPGRYVYYGGTPMEPWKQTHTTMTTEGKADVGVGQEMDARPVQQHWARVELPAHN